MDASALVQSTAQDYLAQRGEPAQYLKLQAAGLLALARHGKLSIPDQNSAEIYNEIRSALEFGLTFQSGFQRFGPSEHSIEIGLWWAPEAQEVQPPLADRVERKLITFLLDEPGCDFAAIDTAICQAFPGLETPEETLIEAILESYAERDQDGKWWLRESDAAQARREDRAEIRQLLIQLGEMLGFVVEAEERSLTWHHLATKETFHFHIIASAILGRIVTGPAHDPAAGLIVLPGGRSKLVLHKQERNPKLEQDIQRGWRFLKFRSVRRLWENPKLTRENLADQIALDPISLDDPQMPLL
jgi:hypothetical protein